MENPYDQLMESANLYNDIQKIKRTEKVKDN